MPKEAITLISIVALIHLAIGFFEIAHWEWLGGRLFPNYDAETLEKTKVLAGNQGVYNLMLAVALFASLKFGDPSGQRLLAIVLLSFIVIVGIYGAITIKPTIAIAQSIPAAIGLYLLR